MSDILTETPDEPMEQTPDASEPSTSVPGERVEDGASPTDVVNSNSDLETSERDGAEEDGLPEWEPLTPELVEDEAIRGDFVIRWAVIGLALLLGVSQISETRTLVHLKSGQYLISHGILPGGNDVFSSTANDHRWVNYSWLFDLAMACVYSATGGVGLSLVQGLITCVAFGFLAHSLRPDIRTWWGSICAAMALLACYLQFTVQPELITLLGVCFVLWTLVKSEEPAKSHLLWRLVPAIWLWAQCDQRAWFGWFLLILWTIGEWFSREPALDGERRLLAKVSLCSFLIVAVHPFLWESWLAPIRLYTLDYPALCAAFPQPLANEVGFHPIWTKFLWVQINHRTIAALFLVAATIVTLILNRSQARWSHVFIILGFNALSLFASHELAAASLVNCVICTLNAQIWYRRTFGQVYSIDWRELLFSRGGRAVTVVSFFALAWLILSGRLDGPGGKRTGVGFEGQLAIAMNDYQNLTSQMVDDRPFNFSIPQGDLMIWSGQKPFVDSRASLYYSVNDDNLLKSHQKARVALRKKRETNPGSGEADVWKETFAKYKIRQVCPRLSGPVPAPDYISFFDLLGSNDFKLTQLNSSTGLFVRKDSTDASLITYLSEHPFDTTELAFRAKSSEIEESTREFSKAATTYDNLFSLRRPTIPSGVQTAQHFRLLAVRHSSANEKDLNSKSIAATFLAIREANNGLRVDPNSGQGYLTLGMVYSYLGWVESQLMKQGIQAVPSKFRYYQSVAAFRQALELMPDDTEVMEHLLRQYEMFGRVDVRFVLMSRLSRLKKFPIEMSDEDRRREREKIAEVMASLEQIISQLRTTSNQYLSQGADRLQVANTIFQAGGLLAGISILEEDAIYLSRNPSARLTLASWLMEVGRGQEAADILDSFDRGGVDQSLSNWRRLAAINSTVVANYRRAINLWSEQSQQNTDALLQPVMLSLPFLSLNPLSQRDGYPITNTSSTLQLLQGVRRDNVGELYQTAVVQIESGDCDQAIVSMRKALELDSSSAYAPLFQFYFQCLTGEKIELPVSRIEGEVFADIVEPISESQNTPESGAKVNSEVPKEKPEVESPPQ